MHKSFQIASRLLVVVLLAGLVAGCGSSLKSAWGDFTAYYNTFYNAKKSYRTGYSKVQEQKVNINPEQPIRIHPSPLNTGTKDFENTIDKGAEILRNHSESRWVDDALLLIGKSYFFSQKYFSADQKFFELYRNAGSREMKQKAVMWRGRVYLEMDLNTQGISYLESELSNFEKWEDETRAEIHALLAEMYTGREEWQQANDYLVKAIPDLKDKSHKARAYFLHGQVLEKLDRLDEAAGAYREVEGYHPAYELVYQSNRKEAEVSRRLGRYERAYNIFDKMARDDKNFEVQATLQYEIGKTEQARGNYKAAEEIYKQVLHNSINPPAKETVAKSYYGLAEVNRYYYKDFELAAAYYDSASGVSVEEEKLPEAFNAETFARSFGNYAQLKEEIARQDSLMWLGSLPKAKFDSVLVVIKKKMAQELAEQRKERERQSNSMVNIGRREAKKTTEQDFESGFLNYRDAQQVTQSINQFRAVWGGRPLVDNWRRIVAVRTAVRNKEQSDSTSEAGIDSTGRQGQAEMAVVSDGEQEVRIDLSEIPFTPEARKEMEKKMAQAKYELGNTFFLSLEMPDSAAIYYEKVINQYPHSELTPQAMYSLAELYYVNNEDQRARNWANRLVEAYPGSRYVSRLADRYDLQGIERKSAQTTSIDTARVVYESMADSLQQAGPVDRAEKLRAFAMMYPSSNISPNALLEAARTYMQLGREDSLFRANASQWYRAQQEWEEQKAQLQVLRDSAQTVLQDTTLSEDVRSKWQTIADSTAPEAPYQKYYPFRGTHWDSTRSVLAQLSASFPKYTEKERVQQLAEQLKLPDRFTQRPEDPAAQRDSTVASADSLQRSRAKLQGPVDTSAVAAPDSTAATPSDTTAASDAAPDNRGAPVRDTAAAVPDSADTAIADSVQATETPQKPKTCEALGIEPRIAGGMDAFMSNISYPKSLQNLNVSGAITYAITIDKQGKPVDYELKTKNSMMISNMGIDQLYNKAIEEHLQFEPLMFEGEAVEVRCEVRFPVNLKEAGEPQDTTQSGN